MSTKYPGMNKLQLSDETMQSIVQQHLEKLHPDVRIMSISHTYGGVDVKFTTDKPEPSDQKKYEQALATVALWNDAEKKLNKRVFNIDPSCVTTEKLILPS